MPGGSIPLKPFARGKMTKEDFEEVVHLCQRSLDLINMKDYVMKHHVFPNVEMDKDEDHGLKLQTKIVEIGMTHCFIFINCVVLRY